jgi:hypothetical protein
VQKSVPVKLARLLRYITISVVLIRIRESIAFPKSPDFATDFWRTLHSVVLACFDLQTAVQENKNSADTGKHPGSLNLKTAVAGLKIAHLREITLAFEFLVLTLTVPGLRAKNFKILRAFAYQHHFHAP